jgi:hypothetical protein
MKSLLRFLDLIWLLFWYLHWAHYDSKRPKGQMKTAIGYPTYYTVIYRRRLGGDFVDSYFRRHIGNYTDIRDAIQAIVTAYSRRQDDKGEFMIGTSSIKPKHWLHPTRYNET